MTKITREYQTIKKVLELKGLIIESEKEFLRKSNETKILAKELGYGHWDVYKFITVINGNKYISNVEVSCNSISSPCSNPKLITKSIKEMNDLFINLQNKGYKSFGKFEQDVCGVYRKINS